jgi:hypothetical protein
MSEIIEPEEIYRRLRFNIVKDFTALILMSDGVTDPKFENVRHQQNKQPVYRISLPPDAVPTLAPKILSARFFSSVNAFAGIVPTFIKN